MDVVTRTKLVAENESVVNLNRIGQRIGLTVSYLLFTTFLFLILKITGNWPESWNFFHLATITLLLVFTGWIAKSWLK